MADVTGDITIGDAGALTALYVPGTDTTLTTNMRLHVDGTSWDTYDFDASASLTIPDQIILCTGNILQPSNQDFDIDLVFDNAVLSMNFNTHSIRRGTISGENGLLILTNTSNSTNAQFPSSGPAGATTASRSGITNLNLSGATIRGEATHATTPTAPVLHLRGLTSDAVVNFDGAAFEGEVTIQAPLIVDWIGVTGPVVSATADRFYRWVAPKIGTDNTLWAAIVDGDWSASVANNNNMQIQGAQYTGAQEVHLIGGVDQFGAQANMTLGANAGSSGAQKTLRRMFAYNPQFVDSATGTQINDVRIRYTLGTDEEIYKPSATKTTALAAVLSSTGWIVDDSNGYWFQTDEIAGSNDATGTTNLALQHGTNGTTRTINVKSYTHVAPTATITTAHHTQNALHADGSGFTEQQTNGWGADAFVGAVAVSTVNAIDGTGATDGTATNMYRRVKAEWYTDNDITEVWTGVIGTTTTLQMTFDRSVTIDTVAGNAGVPTIASALITIPVSNAAGLIADDSFNSIDVTGTLNLGSAPVTGFTLGATTYSNVGDATNTTFSDNVSVGSTNRTWTNVDCDGTLTIGHSGFTFNGGSVDGITSTTSAYTSNNVTYNARINNDSGHRINMTGGSLVAGDTSTTRTELVTSDLTDVRLNSGIYTISTGSFTDCIADGTDTSTNSGEVEILLLAAANSTIDASSWSFTEENSGVLTFSALNTGITVQVGAALAGVLGVTDGQTVGNITYEVVVVPEARTFTINSQLAGNYIIQTGDTLGTVQTKTAGATLEILDVFNNSNTDYKIWWKPTSVLDTTGTPVPVIYDYTYAEWNPSTDASGTIIDFQPDPASAVTGTATATTAFTFTAASALSSGVAAFTITSAATSYTDAQGQTLAWQLANTSLYLLAVATAGSTNAAADRLIVFGQSTVGPTVTYQNDLIRLQSTTGQKSIAGSSGFLTSVAGTAPNTFDTILASSTNVIFGSDAQIGALASGVTNAQLETALDDLYDDIHSNLQEQVDLEGRRINAGAGLRGTLTDERA